MTNFDFCPTPDETECIRQKKKKGFDKNRPFESYSPRTGLCKDAALLLHISLLSCEATVRISVAENWRNKIRNCLQRRDAFGDWHKAVYRVEHGSNKSTNRWGQVYVQTWINRIRVRMSGSTRRTASRLIENQKQTFFCSLFPFFPPLKWQMYKSVRVQKWS